MWYSVSILMKSVREDDVSDEVWEERILLINSVNQESVLNQAKSIGQSAEHEYRSEGLRVRWLFHSVGKICKLSEVAPKSGSEVFVRYLKKTGVMRLMEKFDE